MQVQDVGTLRGPMKIRRYVGKCYSQVILPSGHLTSLCYRIQQRNSLVILTIPLFRYFSRVRIAVPYSGNHNRFRQYSTILDLPLGWYKVCF